MPRVLIAEDEVAIADVLLKYFERDGYEAEVIANGAEVERRLAEFQPDLLLLDLQLPGKNGLEICRSLREAENSQPIMMITARVEERDRLTGLDLGADDYICKPFSPREVLARARAVLRRSQSAPVRPGQSRIYGRLRVDLTTGQLAVAGQEVQLTPQEFDLLLGLLEQVGEVCSRSTLLAKISGRQFAGYERNIDTHVKNLRRKLTGLLPTRQPIRSVYRRGYLFDASECE